MNIVNAPVGSIVAYPCGPSQVANPFLLERQGWMLCDGRSVSVNVYPELFSVISYAYGGSNESFAIPDYRHLALKAPDNAESPAPPPSYYIIKFLSLFPG